MWLSCPPVALWPLAWVALAPLILSVTRAVRLRQALWRGYLFGCVSFGATCYWIGLTIAGWTGSSIGWLAWGGLTLVAAGFYGAWGGAAWWLARRLSGGARLLALASAWVIMEWARTAGSISMPWAQLSYTQVRFLPVLQIADVTGAYGVSFLLMLANGSLAEWHSRRGEGNAARWVWLSATLVGMIALAGAARMRAADLGKPVTVAAFQSHFGVRETYDDTPKELAQIQRMTRLALETHPRPDLAVWSESAAPGDALHYPTTRRTLELLARDYDIPILIGSRVVDPETSVEANSSVLFLPDGSTPQRYDKRQLVPFGEYIPFRSYIPAAIANAFQFFDRDAERGGPARPLVFARPGPLTVASGVFICYESMFPQYAREMTLAGANLLVTQSNDDWFRSHAAMEQHLAAVVLRAIEDRRDIVRSTTSGVTCVVDDCGRIVRRAPLDMPAFIISTVRLREGRTLYTRFGDWFVILSALLILAAVRRSRPNRGIEPRSAPE